MRGKIKFYFAGNGKTREFRNGTDMYKYAIGNDKGETYYIETEHVMVSYTREEFLKCWRVN